MKTTWTWLKKKKKMLWNIKNHQKNLGEMNIIEKFGIDRFSAQNLFEFFKTFLSFKKIATNLSGEAGLSKKIDFFKR